MDREGMRATLAGADCGRARGRVVGVRGVSLRLTLPGARLGDVVTIGRRGEPLLAQVIGFEQGEVLAVALGELRGVGIDDVVEGAGLGLEVPFDRRLLGRVLDARGAFVDGGKVFDVPLAGRAQVHRAPPLPLERVSLRVSVATGVRAIDALFTLGRGQRIGLFAGPGAGKSELLAQMARSAAADVVVIALVGERGREVVELVEHGLGDEARRRAVVVVATSDAAPLERITAAQTATALAEGFRDAGLSVLLLVDSLTRLARAQRDVGLAAGEPPGRRGYPPSVYSLLPRLLERAGATTRGSITAVYSVLTEGDDLDEPIADEVRGLLDGHIVLSRRLAERGHFPAIDVGASLSRFMPALATEAQKSAAQRLRRWWAAYEEKRDLIALGAYRAGSDTLVDEALGRMPRIERFLRQARGEHVPAERAVNELIALTE